MRPETLSSTAISAGDLRSLLTDRLRKAGADAQPSPLSSAQQRLWFLDQLQPNSPLYNIPCVARLTGALDVGALKKALGAVVARHESLRTRFANVDGEPAQVIDEPTELPLAEQDLSELPESEREAEMERLVRQEIRRPFNLSADRLVRATLLRLKAEEYVLIINMHHIVSDEWSLKIFYRELADFYQGYVESKPVSLPEPPIQYVDYALWQREWLRSKAFEKQLGFWKDQLGGNPPALELPTDHPRRSGASFPGAVETRVLGSKLWEELKELTNREGVTLFMTLLAAFNALLYRYTQQEDIIVGSPMAGRNRMETEDLIGFFVNTLPLRTRISGNPTFRELLAQVREVALGAYSHQDLPFDKLVEALQPERSPTQTPFVKVMFLTQNEAEEVRLPNLRIEFLERGTDTAKFDLTLGVQETDTGLVAGIEYDTGLFEAATIRRMLQQYETLLRGIVADPGRRLSELPLLAETERHQILERWGQTTSQSSPGLCLHQWFERQAERTPESVALVCEQRKLTYGELNAQANQLAHYLKSLGVGPEVPVALSLERSPQLVVAILGVLKAGGAYVPIDPAYPKERLSFILQDTRAPVLLTQANVRANLPSEAPQVVCLDSEWDKIAACPSANEPSSTNNPQQAAYIIYTSGSTGTPKGVVVSHYNVVRLFQQTEQWYGFNATDVWTLFHSYTFDFSVWELWGALLYGGRLVMVPYLVSRSPSEFYQLLSEQKVTVLNQTPSAFRQLLWAEATAPAPLPLSLRYVIFGGEALELQSLKPWFELHGDEQPLLVNMYGITETTVHVTYRPIRAADLSNGVGSVIGVPIPDLRIYLLDEKLEPVPVGVPGEICVGGAGVARGYLNRPELSREKFVTDPFVNEPGTRLYRSGDLARFTASGELEYLGRMDHQVKVRGFRVELGEIESALNRHPAIRESLVLAADGAGGSKRLVAYFVPKQPAPTLAEVRESLTRSLPEHMIPSVFVPMEALPLTPNGKVDRRALPAPENVQVMVTPTCVPPRNATEQALAEIWGELLRCKSISVHANFFHLGGHSLLATQVISRIAGAFQVELPVRTIFEAPTIAGLAEAVLRAQQEEPSGASAIIRREGSTHASKLLARLERLSEAELQTLLTDSKLKDILS
jgi:amino acid adenylation domain-containing protein